MNMRALLPFRRESGNFRPPMTVFDTLQNEVDRLFDEFSRGFGSANALSPAADLIPNMDVMETDKQIELTVELPGLQQKDVDISFSDNMLTLSGEKKIEQEREEKNARVMERAYGRFFRSFQLPQGVDPSAIEATMENGVLKVVIPKPERMDARRIEVKPAEADQQAEARRAST